MLNVNEITKINNHFKNDSLHVVSKQQILGTLVKWGAGGWEIQKRKSTWLGKRNQPSITATFVIKIKESNGEVRVGCVCLFAFKNQFINFTNNYKVVFTMLPVFNNLQWRWLKQHLGPDWLKEFFFIFTFH